MQYISTILRPLEFLHLTTEPTIGNFIVTTACFSPSDVVVHRKFNYTRFNLPSASSAANSVCDSLAEE